MFYFVSFLCNAAKLLHILHRLKSFMPKLASSDSRAKKDNDSCLQHTAWLFSHLIEFLWQRKGKNFNLVPRAVL